MTVKVGIIGAGGMAQGHIQALRKLNDVNIVGVYDVNRQLANQVAESIGAQSYDSAYELIDPHVIDALFVCTPQFARDDLEEVAARKGIHLFVEKPLGLELEHVRRKERAIIESGVVHSAGYCLRYLDTVQKAKQYLADKQINMITAYRFGGLHAPKWWKQLDQSGGQFVDQTTHQVDLIRYIAGEFEEIYARFELRSIRLDDPDATIYDVGSATFSLKSGIVGNISNTCLSPHHHRAEVEFFGRNFYVSINGTSLKIVDDEKNITETSRMHFYLEQDKTFIDAVRSGSQQSILCGYSDALKTLEVTIAANRSAVERNPVRI